MEMDSVTRKIVEEFKKQFEKENSFGIKLAPWEKIPFLFNIDRAVEVIDGGHEPIFGFYRGLTYDMEDLVLFPILGSQYMPRSLIEKEKEGIRIYCWEDRPGMISLRHNTAMLPVSERHLNRRVNQLDELKARIIIP